MSDASVEFAPGVAAYDPGHNPMTGESVITKAIKFAKLNDILQEKLWRGPHLPPPLRTEMELIGLAVALYAASLHHRLRVRQAGRWGRIFRLVRRKERAEARRESLERRPLVEAFRRAQTRKRRGRR